MRITQTAKRIDSMGVFDYSEGLYASLKRKDKQGGEYYLGYKRGDELLVPRNLVKTFQIDARITHKMSQTYTITGDYRDEDQRRCANESVALLKQGVSHTIKAPTGWGKSYTGGRIALELGQKTLIIIPKTDLFLSWKKNLIQVMGIPADKIGHVQANTIDWKGKDFVITTVQTVIKFEKLGPEFYDYFGTVLWDEGHRMGAEQFSLSCRLFPALYRLALTATPKRGDGRMGIVKAHIGDVMVVGTVIPMKPKVLVVKTGWSIPRHDDEGNEVYFAAGRTSSIIKVLQNGYERNKHILEFALSCYRTGRKHLMMGDHKDQLMTVYKMLLASGVNARDIGWYIGGLDDMELGISAKKPIILATFTKCKEGTDFPEWDCFTALSPKASIEQPAGRVCRFLEGKKQPVILELVDNHVVLQGFFKARLKEYYSMGADIVYMDK